VDIDALAAWAFVRPASSEGEAPSVLTIATNEDPFVQHDVPSIDVDGFPIHKRLCNRGMSPLENPVERLA
jgi:hypothetical protein